MGNKQDEEEVQTVDEQLAADEAAAATEEDDDVFDLLAESHSEHGNLDKLPSDLSKARSDSDEEDSPDAPDEPEQDDGDAPQGVPSGDEPKASDGDSGDIWASATEAQRSEFERLMHSERSQRGRVSALTRQVEQLQNAIQKLEQQPQAPASEDGPKGTGDPDADFKQFAEDYPEIADMFSRSERRYMKQIEELSNQVKGVSQAVQPVVRSQHEQTQKAEFDKVLEAHSDAAEIAASQEFHDWAMSSGQAIRLMYDSDYAEDNIKLLYLYKQDRGLQQTREPDTGDSGKSDDRLSAMEGMPSSRGGPRARKRSLPDDEDALFEQLASQHAKTGTL